MATLPSAYPSGGDLSGGMDPSWSGGAFSDSSLAYGAPNGGSAVSGLVDGLRVDGSWELCVLVDDIGAEVKVRVSGDLHIGGLMHRVSECVSLKQSWADHAIWWSERNMWLLHTRTTLDQYGVQSDARLVFRRTHGSLQVVLPSMNVVVLRVGYASRLFSVVRSICAQLSIRHPEELSLAFPVRRADLKANNPLPIIRHGTNKSTPLAAIGTARSDMPSAHSAHTPLAAYATLRPTDAGSPASPYGTLGHGSASLSRVQSDGSLDRDRPDVARLADCAARVPAKSVFADDWLLRPKGLQQKARLHSGWLDVSRSLMEHGVEPPSPLQEADNAKPPTLYLRFKYHSFYDLNAKYDAVRIHQLYEQARWSLLAGHLDCTEDEMVVFAAYQLQAELQTAHAATAVFSDTLSRYPSLANYASLTTPTLSPDLGGARRAQSPFSTIGGGGGGGGGGSLLYLHSPCLTPRSLLSVPDGGATLQRLSSLPNGHAAGPRRLDEVDELLAELEQSCGVATEAKSVRSASLGVDAGLRGGQDDVDTCVIPVLEDSVRVLKGRILGIRHYKLYWTVVRDARLYLYKSREEAKRPLFEYTLRDCCVAPEVNAAAQRFVIKLSLLTDPAAACQTPGPAESSGSFVSSRRPAAGSRDDVWLRCESADKYAKWVAAFRLGARGKTLASRAAYEKEVAAIMELLRLQMSTPSASALPAETASCLGDLTDFCPERLIKKARSKEALRQRICEALCSVSELSLTEAKLKYIQAWQRLTHYGRTYFIVCFDRPHVGASVGALLAPGVCGEQMIAICQGRVELVNAATGEVMRVWNFSDMRSWNVNWDAGRVDLEFREGQISFRPLSSNCKTLVEFIGGYVFLSQRTPDKNQELNERLFHRLTGVSD